jgi:hypothetical protein
MPPQNPVTRLRQGAIDLNRFADELDADTDLDPTVLRYWHGQLFEMPERRPATQCYGACVAFTGVWAAGAVSRPNVGVPD